MTYTESQQRAIDAFKRFLSGDERVLMLKGAAGTGKTTLVKEFLRVLDSEKWEYGLMAPTGRAAYILGCKTGRSATTIHKGIYGLTKLRATGQNKDEEDDGGLHLRFGLTRNDSRDRTVYLVDEASMLSDSFSENEAFSFGSGCLLTDLFEYLGGRKIVFIGDYAQLPPVGMSFSPALDKEYIETKFSCRVSEIVLRDVMRQSNEGVMLRNASKIRESIEQKSFIEFKLESGPDSTVEESDLLASYYYLSPDRPSVKAAIIAHSNKQALDYNIAVRRHYYGDNSPRLKKGDLLMICRNNYAYEHELFNGNIVQVESCQSDNEQRQREVRVKLGKDRVEAVTLRFRECVIRFGVNGKGVSMPVTLLDNFLDDPNGGIGGLLARALIVDFHNRLPERIKSRLNEIRRLLRGKEKLSIEQQELMETYSNLLHGDPYYNAVVCKYGYAMTCHKAQGGEWENVFVDMGRYGGTANEDYFRWAYTAITRASKKIWYFRSPDFNYISKLVVEEIKPSSNIKVSIYAPDADFRMSRKERLNRMCVGKGISISDDLTKNYQHVVTFTDDAGEKAVFQLWYNASGYSGKEPLIISTTQEFSNLCRGLLEESFVPLDIPFDGKGRPFAEKLVAFMKSQIEEADIQLLNITQEQYQDVFHLKTDGLAKVGLRYTGKGNYTYMTLISSLGKDDAKLETLRQKFL